MIHVIATITLNRPERMNTISSAMLDELMAIPTWPVSGQRPMMENVM